MAEIKKAKEEVATEEDRNRRTQELLAHMGATKDSLGVFAGSILQLGKQVLSFHFGTKPRNVAGVSPTSTLFRV